METTGSKDGARDKPRAPRFPIHTSLRFRVKGEEQWREGQTVNISRSGLLFRASGAVPVKTAVELNFELPVELAEGPGATVVCQGEVVRAVSPGVSDQFAEEAVTIFDYQLVQRPSKEKISAPRQVWSQELGGSQESKEGVNHES